MDPQVCDTRRGTCAWLIQSQRDRRLFTGIVRSLSSDHVGLRDSIGLGLLKLIRLYTLNSPIRKGKYRLSHLALQLSRTLPGEAIVSTTDGRRLYADLSSWGMYESVYFLGEYERAVTEFINSVVRSGDVCLDIGANFGWYTTLLHRLCGTDGAVHAFEPVPCIFASLKKNVALAGSPANVHLNDVALGDAHGKAMMHLFAGLANGHSSLSTMGRADYTAIECPMITLDSYLEKRHLTQVNFVKVDIEGAELMLLKGAGSLFRQAVPPIWMIEMALGTTKGFSYLPNDLILYMKERADYEFYAVDEADLALMPIDGFAPDEIGANVLCVPAAHYRDRLPRAAIRSSNPIRKISSLG
jgi:FkbM family methyltransferase